MPENSSILTHRLSAAEHLPIEDLCKSQTLHTTLEDYRLAVKAGSRHREAAFELALKSTTPFSVGDELLHYRWQGSLL